MNRPLRSTSAPGPGPQVRKQALSRPAIIAVLALAATVGILVALVAFPAEPGTSPGGTGDPGNSSTHVIAPHPAPLRTVVAGQPVTRVAAGLHSLAYGTRSGGVYVETGRTGLRRIAVLTRPVEVLSFDSTGRWLAAADTDMQLAVADTRNPKAPVIRQRLQVASRYYSALPPRMLAVDTTGSHVAVQTDLIGVYSLRDHRPPRWLDFSNPCDSPDDLAFVKGDLISATQGCVNVWNSSTLRLYRRAYPPTTGRARIGHGRILYGTFSHVFLLNYRATDPLPHPPVPGPENPKPELGRVIADKTISRRRSPVQPLADDGRIAAAAQDFRLTFWDTASHRILGHTPLPVPPSCAADKKLATAQFYSSLSPDDKTLTVTAVCGPARTGLASEEEQRRTTYHHWEIAYPKP
ncbi:hypothetical protein HXP44_05690 [Streptomyces sioyaensis]|uniref:WD40 repeat domain-containing protein n=1 Tax=Streptomyces sioyaensis TaxID=67364 RepID=A0A4Q1R0G4_9ACTN|nr:hypothetical protein [Streptomyces sioyaensis]MBM4791566.1 hypothetical protein [Streptomyces sioyaensis]RXS68475.1 hypothetical protein EST54_09105 [Streptomyces sioyaensis]